MTGMAVGGALGGQMAGMVNNMGQTMNNQWQQTAAMQQQTPPPMPGAPMPGAPANPNVQYTVSINGQQWGPYGMDQLRQLVQNNQLTPDTYVWTAGMPQWARAVDVPALAALFAPQGAPVPPPMPPMP